jgi:hypothetical protein
MLFCSFSLLGTAILDYQFPGSSIAASAILNGKVVGGKQLSVTQGKNQSATLEATSNQKQHSGEKKIEESKSSDDESSSSSSASEDSNSASSDDNESDDSESDENDDSSHSEEEESESDELPEQQDSRMQKFSFLGIFKIRFLRILC